LCVTVLSAHYKQPCVLQKAVAVFKPKTNRNASSSTLTRQERQLVADLAIKPKQANGKQHGNAKAMCWQYVGAMYRVSDDLVVDDTRLYCSPCLESNQKSGQHQCHISSVTSFAKSTASGSINQHLSLKHGIVTARESTLSTMEKYLTKYDQSSSGTSMATSTHELNRDITIWFCRDLLPFEEVEKEGFLAFIEKNFLNCQVPTAATLSITALNDVYQSCLQRVKLYIKDVPSICVMFDGWTDKYRARPFVGIRVSFIKDWKYHVVSLSCQVLVGHTGQQLADHVSSVINSFFSDPKKMFRSTCHDGAANMFKASKVLKVDYFQHCVAHGLHLLLTVDSLNHVPEVQELLQKCRIIVSKLHFKSYLLSDELAAKADRVEVDRLSARIAAVSEIQELDDTFPVADNEDASEDNTGNCDAKQSSGHQHTTLKLSCPTRWNSSLVMLESIRDLHSEVQNALKKIGHAELCINAEELDMIKELASFLKEFETFTDLVSSAGPTLSLISLMELKIRKMCKNLSNDDTWLKAVKNKIAANVGRRLKSNEAAKIQRILDPDTKGIVARETAVAMLLAAATKCSERGIISSEDEPGTILLKTAI